MDDLDDDDDDRGMGGGVLIFILSPPPVAAAAPAEGGCEKTPESETAILLPVSFRRLMIMFRIGRGTGHLAVLVAVVVVVASVVVPVVDSSFPSLLLLFLFLDAKTCRKLKFNASADGHDLANKIRRTTRFDALFNARVNESPGEFCSSSSVVVGVVSISADTDSRVEEEEEEVAEEEAAAALAAAAAATAAALVLYDRESDTSDGAMQKSISFTFPLYLGVTVDVAEVASSSGGSAMDRSDVVVVVVLLTKFGGGLQWRTMPRYGVNAPLTNNVSCLTVTNKRRTSGSFRTNIDCLDDIARKAFYYQ